MSGLIHSPAWKALAALARSVPDLKTLAGEPDRATRWTFALDDGFALDLSKQPLTSDILAVLMGLVRQQEVERWRNAMFAGEIINRSENRAAAHIALRAHADEKIMVGTENVVPEVFAIRGRMDEFAEAVRGGAWTGATGKKIETVVHIGIGGSHLGPELAVKALRPYHDGPAVRFVANVDPADLSAALHGLDPATTLFIIASKTFTTQETLANARAARAWVVAALGEAAVAKHFVAASTNEAEVKAFGIDVANMFPFRDWVGGRYSLWSAIGLPILLAVGPRCFDEFLGGARDMDEHFRRTPMNQNLPVLLALAGLWNRNFMSRACLAVLPYAQDLALLPAYLQQLEMESNGKSVNRTGEAINHMTCPVVFGQPGTNGQHAFYQQLHQGPETIPCDFIAVLKAHEADEALAPGQQKLLAANAFAQGAALLQGRESADWHRRCAGNRPSTTIVMEKLTPANLGRLLALYEHKVAVQGWLWGVNSFDQFGVELGKELAKNLLAGKTSGFDSSTQALMARLES